MEERKAGYEIVIAGRNVKWPRNEIKYEEIKEEWDKLSPDRTIVGNPPIHYSREERRERHHFAWRNCQSRGWFQRES